MSAGAALVDLPAHRFERDDAACWWRCTPPPFPGWGRAADACQGCGLAVSDEELLACGLEPPAGGWSDLWLNTVVLLRARRLYR